MNPYRAVDLEKPPEDLASKCWPVRLRCAFCIFGLFEILPTVVALSGGNGMNLQLYLDTTVILLSLVLLSLGLSISVLRDRSMNKTARGFAALHLIVVLHSFVTKFAIAFHGLMQLPELGSLVDVPMRRSTWRPDFRRDFFWRRGTWAALSATINGPRQTK